MYRLAEKEKKTTNCREREWIDGALNELEGRQRQRHEKATPNRNFT